MSRELSLSQTRNPRLPSSGTPSLLALSSSSSPVGSREEESSSSSNSSQDSSSSLDLMKSTEFLSEESTSLTASLPPPRSVQPDSVQTRSLTPTSRNSSSRNRKQTDRLSSSRATLRPKRILRISRRRNRSRSSSTRSYLRTSSLKIQFLRDTYRLDFLSERT